jgi:hypothetical protein
MGVFFGVAGGDYQIEAYNLRVVGWNPNSL